MVRLEEQNDRAVKRKVKPMFGFKSLRVARDTIAGIDAMQAIRKGRLAHTGGEIHTPAEQCYLPAV